jgi:putative protein-disulfide isomerase
MSGMAAYISQAYRRVEETTGIRFGTAFLQGILLQDDYQLNSVPPSRALAVVQLLKPEAAVAYAHGLQELFYAEGKSLNDSANLAELAQRYGIDSAAFISVYSDPKSEKAMLAGFKSSYEWGVQGFPTIVVLNGKSVVKVASGYLSFEELNARLKQFFPGN